MNIVEKLGNGYYSRTKTTPMSRPKAPKQPVIDPKKSIEEILQIKADYDAAVKASESEFKAYTDANNNYNAERAALANEFRNDLRKEMGTDSYSEEKENVIYNHARQIADSSSFRDIYNTYEELVDFLNDFNSAK